MRYKVQGDWRTAEENEFAVLEVSTLIDTRGGYEYPYGAQRVRLKRPVEGFKTKTFKGEMAGHAADNHFRDVTHKALRSLPIFA